MCAPSTRRTRPRAALPRRRCSTSSTHGPAALTSARAAIVSRRPLARSSSVTRQTSPSRTAECASVPTRIAAPRSAASRALSTTRRASSTQQSEYSKAVVEHAGPERPPGGVARQDRARACRAAARGRPGGRRGTTRRAASTRGAGRRGAAARSAWAARCAGRCATAPRARSATRAPGGNRNAPGSAGRRGSAWSSARRCRWPDPPSRTGTPNIHAPPHRGRCRSR